MQFFVIRIEGGRPDAETLDRPSTRQGMSKIIVASKKQQIQLLKTYSVTKRRSLQISISHHHSQ
ncbi:MAG: hypothetical protein AAGA21_25525 [Pseudomonadota bacterium]